MAKFWKKGFTLAEIAVVLAILGILLAVAIPAAVRYIKLAEFRKNEENARTAYLAAESTLTWYRSSGEWKTFQNEMKAKGTLSGTFEEDEKNTRIYGIVLNSSNAPEDSPSGELVHRLLDTGVYDKGFFDGAIALEIDIETGQVYSAFYGTRCNSLSYTESEEGVVENISAADGGRDYKNRRERLLGYYSVEELSNVTALKPVRLKVTTVSLVNSETLSLNWSGNSRHSDLDVKYKITFYSKENNKELFSADVDLFELRSAGEDRYVHLDLYRKSASDGSVQKDLGEWMFPLAYQSQGGLGGRFSLVLDGMMSADLTEAVCAESAEETQKEYSTSITRLKTVIPELQKPLDIYAEIEAEPSYKTGDLTEYRPGSLVRSNVENTMFDESSEKDGNLDAKITRFRHLSNIRYCQKEDWNEAVFTLTARNLDWTSSGVGFYDRKTGANDRIEWKNSAVGEEVLDFPSIRLLNENHTLKTNTAVLSNLRLGENSVPDDKLIQKLYAQSAHYTEYLGLFCEIDGNCRGLTFSNPKLSLEQKQGDGNRTLNYLSGVGILSGRSGGKVEDIAVNVSEKDAQTVDVQYLNRSKTGQEQTDSRAAGIGGLIGVIAGKGDDGGLVRLTDWAVIKNLKMDGAVVGRLPVPHAVSDGLQTPEAKAKDYRYGIGGIFGYGYIGDDVKIASCKNNASVKGNLFTGGIGGNLTGSFASEAISGQESVSIQDCDNEGLVLCLTDHEEEEHQLEGRYFGGILGFGDQVKIDSSVSASGRADNYRYDVSQREEVLLGQYVGGIIGYGSSSRIAGCSTQTGGYILGSDYVGGIAGGLSNDARTVITGNNGISVTTNAGYVIGNYCVGGIIGKNDGTAPTTLLNCINNGVAAGYEEYIGGIVGYNGENGMIRDCASYVSDYDGMIFQTIVKTWEAVGDCAGGLAGYNNGDIVFSAENPVITVKSVSGVVTGRNYVGGIIGFNDVNGTLDVAYTLIGGRVYAYGNGAGGCIGLNASEQILNQTIAVKPGSVTGNYYVGGCIGANVVDLSKDTVMDGFKSDNTLGNIEGKAFVGGVIGYQRTYTKEQLDKEAAESISLLDYLKNETVKQILPVLNDQKIPSAVMQSGNPYCFTVSNRENSNSMLASDNNNMPVFADLYVGGIVGYCERNSRLKLVNCKNSGNISKSSLENSGRVSLKEYLKSQEVGVNADSLGSEDIKVSIGGGVIGANLDNQIIDHCSNTGTMNDFIGLGGIVGFNAGGVFNCTLSDHFGSPGQDYIGGIAGLNVSADSGQKELNRYEDVNRRIWEYFSGTIAMCSTQAGRNISGRSCVGGIAGYNMAGALLKENKNRANVTGAKDYAGGIAGKNYGEVRLDSADVDSLCTITGNSGTGIGGIAGFNGAEGKIIRTGSGEAAVVGDKVSIAGKENVGGIVGINEGVLTASQENAYFVCAAKLVHAKDGQAGGIIGKAGKASGAESGGRIVRACNKSESVMSDHGPAGGIVAVNGQDFVLRDCRNLGKVVSDQGYAGGICAENYGQIVNCSVGDARLAEKIEISSRGADAVGTVCAVNYGVISDSFPAGNVTISGTAKIIGGIAGINSESGVIQSMADVKDPGSRAVASMPEINVSANNLTVGGVAGQNRGLGSGNGGALIRNMAVSGLAFTNFSNYRFLGGIAGENQAGAGIENCGFYNGQVIQREGGAAGNCYGGIAGRNSGILEECRVESLMLDVRGVYTATSTSTAAEKENLSSHVGGIAGKNEMAGGILGCVIAGSGNTIHADSGMAGGVAGYNKGNIEHSGDLEMTKLMKGPYGAAVSSVEELISAASAAHAAADGGYVVWNETRQMEDQTYSDTNKKVSADRSLSMIMSTNGNVGGIAAYNAPTGRVAYCATGNWYLNNKSQAIGVGTGGIIGMNESEKELSFLLNRAFVGRQLSGGDTDRFAGGIVGNQNNSTSSKWSINNSVNYGTVYCKNTHYSGGILGQWTGSGGTVEKCYNYGNLQTTYGCGWLGASGGIVAQIYHAYENHEYRIAGCGNYGNIYGRTGKNVANCANDSAGILGNVTAYRVQNAANAQNYTIEVTDCVNGAGVEIYSASMASGIVGFFSCDNPGQSAIETSTGNIELNIARCRNYASVLKGSNFVGGILGDRYGAKGSENTTLKYCFSVNRGSGNYNQVNNPVVSYKNGASRVNSINSGSGNRVFNFFLSENAVSSFPGGTLIRDNGTDSNLQRANAGWVYRLVKNNTQYFVYLNPGSGSISINSITINNNDVLYAGSTIGRVLFTVAAGDTYANMNSVVREGSIFDNYVREFCYTESGMLIAPEKVILSKENRDFTVCVEASSYAQSDVEYEAVLYRKGSGGEADEIIQIEGSTGSSFVFEGEEYKFRISDAEFEKGGEVFVRLSARNKNGSERSAEVDSNTVALYVISAAPQIRAELMGTEGNYQYRFSLLNAKDFTYDDWEVELALMDGTVLRFDSARWENYYRQTVNALEQLIVTTTVRIQDESGNIQTASDQTSLPVYLPANVPEITLHKSGNAQAGTATPSSTVSGVSLSDLSITVTLSGNGGNITTPPVYRADLIGTWKDENGVIHEDTVFQSTDILTTAGGAAAAEFADLPEYIADAEDMKVRVWYAQSGLGPVYTYYAVNQNDAYNISTLTVDTQTAEDGTKVTGSIWEYAYSNVLSDNTFAQCRWTSENLFEWLPRPQLMEIQDGKSLAPDLSDDGLLTYTFRWDEETYQAGDRYLVTMNGIIKNADGSINSRVSVLTDREVPGNFITEDARNWSYDAVELIVTRKGDAAGTGKVGLTAEKTYPIRKRLPRPEQPRVTNPDINELYYMVEWDAIQPETGCVSYQIYIQPYAEDNVTLEEAVPVCDADGNPQSVPAAGVPGNIYRTGVNLEAYSGRRVQIYLKAQAAINSEEYIDSINGITFELAIPKRLSAPRVVWEKNWEYDKADAKSFEEFQNGGLSVAVTADASSIPPGGSSYLLKAYVFESAEAAEAARSRIDAGEETNLDGLLAAYPSVNEEGRPHPVQMDTEAVNRYSHAMSGLSAGYAGRYILFYTRISSGDGNVSSEWVSNPAIWRLPYAELSVPAVTVGSAEREAEAVLTPNPDLENTSDVWKANHTALCWSSVEYADAYYAFLTAKDGNIYAFKLKEDGEQVRVSFRNADNAWEELGSITDGQEIVLDSYHNVVPGRYAVNAALMIPCQTDLKAVISVKKSEGGGFEYAFILPDAVNSDADSRVDMQEADLIYTRSVNITADVEANEADPGSSFYVKSEPYEVVFHN